MKNAAKKNTRQARRPRTGDTEFPARIVITGSGCETIVGDDVLAVVANGDRIQAGARLVAAGGTDVNIVFQEDGLACARSGEVSGGRNSVAVVKEDGTATVRDGGRAAVVQQKGCAVVGPEGGSPGAVPTISNCSTLTAPHGAHTHRPPPSGGVVPSCGDW